MSDDVLFEQRVIIKFYVKLGKSLSDIKADLENVYGDNALKKSTICKWIGRFKDGRNTFEDDPKSGRPSTSVTAKTIADVQNLVFEDRRVTVREVAETFHISYGSAQEILTDQLGMSRVCARWVPRLLTPEQMGVRVQNCKEFLERVKVEGSNFTDRIITCDETWVHFYEPESKQQSSVWKHPMSPSPVKAKLTKSVGKVMCIMFFTSHCFLLNHVVPPNTTINGEYYATIIRRNLTKAIKKKQPDLLRRGAILHHDNAPVHKANVVHDTLQNLNIETISHPPYSPDLAPCDFWLFPVLKDSLRGMRYESREELTLAMTGSLRVMSRDGLAHVFRSWETRMAKCIEYKGGYFEKQ